MLLAVCRVPAEVRGERGDDPLPQPRQAGDQGGGERGGARQETGRPHEEDLPGGEEEEVPTGQ